MRVPTVALACVLASCAYVEATSVQYVGVPRFPAEDPAKVQVLRAEPAQRHHRLGEVMLDMSVEPAPQVEEIERRLREETAKMGGQAIYIVRDVARPYEDRKMIGIAIRYLQ
jgi:hypothetical protein